MKNYKRVISTLLLSGVSTFSFAAQVNLTKVTELTSLAPGQLNHTVDRIVDSFGAAYREEFSATGGTLVKANVDPALRQINKKSIARFEYRYLQRGKEVTRIYHSFSGETPVPFKGVVSEEQKRAFASRIEAQMGENERIVTGKMTEEEYAQTGRYFRAASYARANDAEIKAMRRIEQDILSGDLTSGGELTVYINQMPCESCSPLFNEQLAEWPEIATAEVSYLPQTRSYFGASKTEAELAENDWYRYLSANNGLAVGAEEGLQQAFTSNRTNKTKFANFKNRYNALEEVRTNPVESTACGF
ncbi:hypothetical protein [Algicola sagamiensis]|uniref:hypothetical protein n=1 Tax=Algicola sagamiensis TaxID=163869 RepID=UPI000375AD72|nr:hypothetical protein [Algicola sagamiensis]